MWDARNAKVADFTSRNKPICITSNEARGEADEALQPVMRTTVRGGYLDKK